MPIRQKDRPLWALRKVPEIFCCSLLIRRSRSAWLIENGTRKSNMNASVSARRFFSRSSKLRGSLCLRRGRLAPQRDQGVAAGSLATLRR